MHSNLTKAKKTSSTLNISTLLSISTRYRSFFFVNPELKKFSHEDSEELIVKLDVESMKRLSFVSNLKRELARILKMPEYLLHVVDIEVGCVEVKFLIPAKLIFASNEVLSREQRKTLKALFVISINCSSYPQPMFSNMSSILSKEWETSLSSETSFSSPRSSLYCKLPLSHDHYLGARRFPCVKP